MMLPGAKKMEVERLKGIVLLNFSPIQMKNDFNQLICSAYMWHQLVLLNSEHHATSNPSLLAVSPRELTMLVFNVTLHGS